MKHTPRLSRAALPAIVGSGLGLAAQGLMALLLLKLYSPEAVGEFSVAAQVAFAWATLALAQSPFSLIANVQIPVQKAISTALHWSIRRWLLMLPLAILMLIWGVWPNRSGTGVMLLFLALGTTCMSLLQAGWFLGQSVALRQGEAWAIMAVRMLPPMAAAGLAGGLALFSDHAVSMMLIVAASVGFGLGCYWIAAPPHGHEDPSVRAGTEVQPAPHADRRGESLKWVHTMSDVAVSTAIAVQWAGLYGAEAAGFLFLALRVLGFVPALVSTAWCQVVLSRPEMQRPRTGLVVACATAGLAALVLLAQAAVSLGWLDSNWVGLQDYLWPVAGWQWAASIMAAVSFRPFLAPGSSASMFSKLCIATNAIQLMLLVLPPLLGMGPLEHLYLFAGASSVMLIAQCWWARSLPLSS